jgi:pyruvate dehydrogenase E2 component (dihydrolipoamide acetyltransferase)
MATIVMPKLSDTMEEGTILKWLKRIGEPVQRGEVLAEVETDKADMELEAADDGTLREIKVEEGQSAAVGAVIAVLEDAGAPTGERAAADERASAGASAGGQRAPVAAPARGTAAAEGGPARSVRDAPEPARARTSGGAVAGPSGGAGEHDVKASPSARKIAEERGIDLRSVRGSGPAGRIVKEDIETVSDGASRAAPAREAAVPEAERPGEPDAAAPSGAPRRASAPPAPRVDDGGPRPAREAPIDERRELSRMRQSIARRMTESFRDVPHFYVTTEIDMAEATRLKDALHASGLCATPVTYTHMILKATALALRRHPRLNASYRDGAIEVKADVNLGIAVAVEDGLIVPVLHHADALSLGAIAGETRRLVEQAHRGGFTGDDLSGATFTVSNMGMLDVEHFAAVINPPQSAILAVGAVAERPVVRDGAVVPGRTMRVTVSCVHRIIDGVVAGRFLEEL